MKVEERPALQRPIPVERKTRPVMFWAMLGAMFLALIVYLLVAWLTSGNVTTTHSGPTPVPTWMKVTLRTWEFVGIPITIYTVYHFVVRPWRRDGRLSPDGLMLLAMMTCYWQDIMLDYTQYWCTYNSYLFNFGSWNAQIPGWLPPNGNQLVEPFLWAWPLYAYMCFLAAVLGCFVMRKAKARWPELGKFGLFMVCFGFIFVLDVILEPVFMALGFYTYAGAIPWMTIFHGHYYQLPIYQSVLFSATLAGWASLRYFRNDKGQTVAERGIDQMRCTARNKTRLRFLALVGVANVIYLGFYNIPYQFFALHAAPWPKDIIERSYFTNNLCGPGTEYACSGPNVPIPRPDSAHLSPDGELVVPAGTKLPGDGD